MPAPTTAILTAPIRTGRSIGCLRLDSPPVEAVEVTPLSIGTVRPRSSRISQIVTLVAVVVPPLGLASAAGLLWGVGFHWFDVALVAALYVGCAFGITIGFHRYFT